MQVYVYVGTPTGASLILHIEELEHSCDSIICSDFATAPLPESNRYNRFVQQGTGLINRDFGGDNYRIDVTKPFNIQDDWQLGVYLAHAMRSQNVLYTCGSEPHREPEPGDLVVWAVGQVRQDLSLSGGSNIQDLLQASESLFYDCFQRHVKVLTLVPGQHSHNISIDLWPEMKLGPSDIGFTNAEDLGWALKTLDKKMARIIHQSQDHNSSLPATELSQQHPITSTADTATRNNINRRHLIVSVLIALVILAGYSLSKPQAPAIASTPPQRHDVPSSTIPNLSLSPDSTAVAPALLEISYTDQSPCTQPKSNWKTVEQPLKKSGNLILLNKVCHVEILRDETLARSLVQLVSMDSTTLVPIRATHTGWTIPLPKQPGERPAVLLISQTTQKPLLLDAIKKYLLEIRFNRKEVLTEESLGKFLQSQDGTHSLYFLTFQSDSLL